MSARSDEYPMAIVTACMNPNGTPDFAWTEVTVTLEQAENGVHYALAEVQLLEQGYEEPFVHFGAEEGPALLHAAVRQYLGLASVPTAPTCPTLVEDR